MMTLYTLLYLDANENNTVNARSRSFDSQLRVYIGCIKTLNASLSKCGVSLELITNDKEKILNISPDLSININELVFTLPVPSGIRFYASHFKLEAFKFLAQRDFNYVGLIDSDIVCINPIPSCLNNCINEAIPLYYDISDQVFPSYGQSRILQEKKLISEKNSLGIWAGGEFIAGPPSFFETLSSEISQLSERYFSQFHLLHHQGDEFLTSVAIENCLLGKKAYIQDAGKLNIIGRYWNFPPKHEQRSLGQFMECFLLHLPSNKKELAQLSDKISSNVMLKNNIRYQLLLNRPFYQIKALLQRLLKMAR